MNHVPEWLEKEAFAVQHNPNFPSRYPVRLLGHGCGTLDFKPDGIVFGAKVELRQLTRGALGFGKTLNEAAEYAWTARAEQPRTPLQTCR